MGRLKISHIVEAVLWLALCLILYIYSFEFNREIEIYRFGASAWPRAILLLVAVAVLGQLVMRYFRGEAGDADRLAQAADDRAGAAASTASHNTPGWYVWTFGLLAIPFIYMNLPEWIASAMSLEKSSLHSTKHICAVALTAIYILAMRGNHVGAILALPILFAAFLQDFGFYAMAPIFIFGVMYLMGERRYRRMIVIMAGLFAILLMLFVSLLYVGLPTGNISPFYEFGTTIVNILQ